MGKEEIIKNLKDTLNDINEILNETNSISSGWEKIISLYEDAIVSAENNRFFSIKAASRIYREFNGDHTTDILKTIDATDTKVEMYFANILRNYIASNVNDNVLEKMINKIIRYEDIFKEFVNYILAGENFEKENPLVVEGYTAEKLCNKTILNPLGAYNYLIYLRENPKEALANLKAGLPIK